MASPALVNVAPPIAILPLHVLVVDGVAINRKMMKRCLEQLGCECDEAANGQEAIQMWSQFPNVYKLIIMDKVLLFVLSSSLFVLVTQDFKLVLLLGYADYERG